MRLCSRSLVMECLTQEQRRILVTVVGPQVLVLDKQLHQQTAFLAFQARVFHLKLLQVCQASLQVTLMACLQTAHTRQNSATASHACMNRLYLPYIRHFYAALA